MEASENLTALQKIAAAQTAPTPRFNTELVRSAWSAIQRRRREARRAARQSVQELGGDTMAVEPDDPIEYAWIDQLWTDHIIVRVEGVDADALRIPYTVDAPGNSVDNVKFGKPEKVRMAYVATDGPAALSRVADMAESVELSKRVRTMAGSRRYRKPIGSQLGSGAPGGDTVATVGKTGSREGPGTTADKLRGAIKDVAREKTYKGGAVFGDIGNEGKLKSALGQIARLPDGKRGAAAAEVVKAAQALGLTALVPASVKRLYRQYIAQGPIKEPSKAPTAKGKK